MPTLIGAAMIAAAILLSTLINALGSRYVGFESPTEESAWLVDRLTGNVYKCSAPQPGRASCEAEIATGSVGDRPKRRGEFCVRRAGDTPESGTPPAGESDYIAARCPARLNPVP